MNWLHRGWRCAPIRRAAGPFFQWPQTGIEGALVAARPFLESGRRETFLASSQAREDEHGRRVQDLPPGTTAVIPEGVKVPARDYRIMHCNGAAAIGTTPPGAMKRRPTPP